MLLLAIYDTTKAMLGAFVELLIIVNYYSCCINHYHVDISMGLADSNYYDSYFRFSWEQWLLLLLIGQIRYIN